MLRNWSIMIYRLTQESLRQPKASPKKKKVKIQMSLTFSRLMVISFLKKLINFKKMIELKNILYSKDLTIIQNQSLAANKLLILSLLHHWVKDLEVTIEIQLVKMKEMVSTSTHFSLKLICLLHGKKKIKYYQE